MKQNLFAIAFLSLSLALMFFSSCSKESPTESSTTSLTKFSGDIQTGAPGDTLSIPLEVLVTDKNGKAVSGQWIEYAVIEGNASLSDTLVVTDDIGKAETTLILGSIEGEIKVEAKLYKTDINTFFTLFSNKLPPSTINILSGNNQSGVLGEILSQELQVEVKNERNQPVGGIIVAFDIIEGSGVLSVLSDTTSSDGIAETKLTLGDSVGTNRVSASIESIDSVEHVIFTATALPPVIQIFGGNGQDGLQGEKLSKPLQVIIKNNQGIPLKDISVTFTITEGTGTLSNNVYTTYELGIAETWLTLGYAFGIVRITAKINGLNTSIEFSAFCVEDLSISSSKIAFGSFRDGGRDIFVMNTDGSNIYNLTNSTEIIDACPSWSPDGSKIAFTASRDGNYEIYVMNADGSNQIRLTYDSATDDFPSWSPDGSKIAFTSIRDGNYGEIYVMNADGSNQTNLTNNPSGDSCPSWSPDGSKIAFSSKRDGKNDIYVMNAGGSNPINLTKNPGYDSYPSWSPDGSKIAFSSNRDGNYDIYVMNADGSNPINITNNPNTNDSYPSWSPDLF